MKKHVLPTYGIVWPEGTPLMRRHLYCAYHNKGNGSFFHRRAIIQALWPDEVYTWHDWSDRMLKSTCDYKLAVWLGAGGTSKSTTAAALAIQWWLEAPMESAVLICSTTIKMLRLRIWSEVSRLFYALPKVVEFRDEHGEVIEKFSLGYLGELIDSDLMVRWRPGDNKHAIFGFGVNEGSVAEAVSNLVGIHARRMWLILDELQGIREAIDNAKDNMSKNALFRVLGMGNSDENMKSLLRRAAKPVNGWDSVDVNNADEWEVDGGVVCERGIVQRFDGRKSPGYSDPKKYPFLITKAQIDAHLRKAGGNESDPGVCSQCFAIWPAIGLQNTVLDVAIIEKFKCCGEPAIWTDGFESAAALDPSFTEGGDRKILQFLKFGLVNDDEGERWMIEMGEWIDVPIDSRSDVPIDYQVVYFCRDACVERGISSDEFALDSTGAGGPLKSIFEVEWGPVMGVEFGGSPSGRVCGYDKFKQKEITTKDTYDRRVSELNYGIRNFAVGNGLRGLSKEASEQACNRRTLFKNKRNTVEKKDEMKKRTGESPDNLDACCIAVDYAIANGASPGGEIVVSRKIKNVMQELAREGATMCSESNLLLEHY